MDKLTLAKFIYSYLEATDEYVSRTFGENDPNIDEYLEAITLDGNFNLVDLADKILEKLNEKS